LAARLSRPRREKPTLRNEPADLALTAARAAELRGEPLEEFARRASDNARRLLRLG